ncbi:MAG: hypothetical protein ACYCTC_09105 [Acidithiobacillus ferrooxidans]|jgi:hypothetical protein|uniref:hypothetical protein n=1 Tax=Acidithiobacillus ferrooxidans TaxID=920 RepID=UPI0021493747|nr:hypothetical protein [Acidithiobacillus ferrooxidans]BDB12867.1 hypothetical protein ANFP_01870 [Acidithiobacillus ferrooxidans]
MSDEQTELISRLRALARSEHDDLSVADEAADEIEQLMARVRLLESYIGDVENGSHDCVAVFCFKIWHLDLSRRKPCQSNSQETPMGTGMPPFTGPCGI